MMCVCIYYGILLSHKEEQINVICNNMDATIDDHPKWSKSEKETNTIEKNFIQGVNNKTSEKSLRKENNNVEYDVQKSSVPVTSENGQQWNGVRNSAQTDV